MIVRLLPERRHTDIPFWEPSEFTFRGVVFRERLAERLRLAEERYTTLFGWSRHRDDSPPYSSGRLASWHPTEYKLLASMKDWLESGSPDEYQLTEVHLRVDTMIFERRFDTFHCGECGGTFGAGNGSVKPWMIGESLAAMGGEMFCCLWGHVVYAAEQTTASARSFVGATIIH